MLSSLFNGRLKTFMFIQYRFRPPLAISVRLKCVSANVETGCQCLDYTSGVTAGWACIKQSVLPDLFAQRLADSVSR